MLRSFGCVTSPLGIVHGSTQNHVLMGKTSHSGGPHGPSWRDGCHKQAGGPLLPAGAAQPQGSDSNGHGEWEED